MNSLLTSLPVLLPIAYAWAEKQELILLETGKPLNEAQLADARRAGVAHPEKVRLALVEKLPQPQNEDVMFVAKQIGLFASHSSGLTVGYGVCLRHGFWQDRYTLAHELVHVGQYEKWKGIRPFLAKYLRECIDPGHPFGGMEQEAIHVSRHICKQPAPAIV